MTVRGGWRQLGLLRLVQALLVVVGVVAMHQMGGGTHGMDVPVRAVTAVVAGPAGQGLPPAEHGPGAPAALTTSAVREDAASLGRAAVSLVGARGDTQAVCVAVLLGLFALLAQARLVARRPRSGTSASGTSHRSAPLGRGPPRLLLAKLCVLRT